MSLNFWNVPTDWVGETVVCIASGPSLTDEDVEYVRKAHENGKCKVIAVNNNYLKAPWCDHLHYCDKQFFNWHKDNEVFKSVKCVHTTMSTEPSREMVERDVKILRISGTYGLSRLSGSLSTGSNSGYQAVNIALLRGSKRVILLGYDCQAQGNRVHWFGNHPQPTSPSVFDDHYVAWKSMKKDILPDEVIINASRETRLDMFPRMPITEALSAE